MQTFTRFVLGILVFVVSSAVFAANEATDFIYPVGAQSVPPTEQVGNANGFTIAQNFNTSSDYGGSPSSPNGGWCATSSLISVPSYTSKATCEANGYKWIYGHTGVDLSNQSCGSTIRATANGVVEFSGGYSGYGYLLKIRHTLPGGRIIYSLYGHRQSALLSAGQVVTKGQTVGSVGNTVGTQGEQGGPCHLHFAMFDQAMPLNGATAPVGYVYDDKTGVTGGGNPITPNIVRYFYDPLLFVNDRNNSGPTLLPSAGYWSTVFSTYQSVTSRTMYITNSAGDVKSLPAAVTSGWLNSVVYWWNGSSWSYYIQPYPIDAYTIKANATYAFGSLLPNLTMYSFYPGNNYLDARWRQDMSDFTNANLGLGFGPAIRSTYSNNPNWSADYGNIVMAYEQVISGYLYYATVSVAYSKTDPLERYVSYYNQQTGVWSAWIAVH